MDQTSANVIGSSCLGLNFHFKSGPWHFTSSDVRLQMHKVSKVVDTGQDKSHETWL